MMFVRGGPQGHWPIPEAYLWDTSHPGLPPREAHPLIIYKAVDTDPHIPTNFIFDKYEVIAMLSGLQIVCWYAGLQLLLMILSGTICFHKIESNPIMGFLLKAPAGVCWQIYIRNSKGPSNGYGDPFG